jgi:hypothetical protein
MEGKMKKIEILAAVMFFGVGFAPVNACGGSAGSENNVSAGEGTSSCSGIGECAPDEGRRIEGTEVGGAEAAFPVEGGEANQ